ncbi:pyridoxine 5'-phosphate synthase [candidate division WOR-3 bacterium]|nr:pyridoxine 5'-phosphate synthase [candidate division WOR-3 bacterium]
MARLSVNIDHVATVREARGINYPDPVQAAVLVESAGAYGITVHLRQDMRHIKERDVELLKQTIKSCLNVELSLNEKILNFILKIKPSACCFVPERAEEVTTEGGLNIIRFMESTKKAIKKLKLAGILSTIFIEPDEKLIKAVPECGADTIEINTGKYSEATTETEMANELKRIKDAATLASSLGLEVHAGHGLNYRNVQQVATIPEIAEFSIGHSIIARAIFVGLERAVKEMITLIK